MAKKRSKQLALGLIEASPLEIIEVSGGELIALDRRLKAEGRRILAIDRVGNAGWRAECTRARQDFKPQNN